MGCWYCSYVLTSPYILEIHCSIFMDKMIHHLKNTSTRSKRRWSGGGQSPWFAEHDGGLRTLDVGVTSERALGWGHSKSE